MGLLQRHTGTQWGCCRDILAHIGPATDASWYRQCYTLRLVGLHRETCTVELLHRDWYTTGLVHRETGAPWGWYIQTIALVHRTGTQRDWYAMGLPG